ncbi:MAG TPA: S-adenosylmethionine:tRNA ribosyltransferase-isomerase [Acidimicrobiales bacterium]|nr:S-adenosylmethionine:tRNA ribosyltransferase-isomerase [Acidimicrobiales bacterium]
MRLTTTSTTSTGGHAALRPVDRPTTPPTPATLRTGGPGQAPSPGPGPAGEHRRLTPRAPLELTGGRRDDARLLVARTSDERLVDARFADLASFLDAGDVIVVNTSATRPAALVVDRELVVHLSTELSDGLWSVELRHLCGNGSTPWLDYAADGPIDLPGGGQLELLDAYRPAGRAVRSGRHPIRLWTARLRLPRPLDEHLAEHGRPIRYGCDAGGWSLAAYQTVFADEPGSAEMPSAARGFTPELVTKLVSKGVIVAPILLHTGVASQEAGEPPYPERYRVGEATAAVVNNARAAGRRIVAVGTTATRAIESVARPDGTVSAGAGWTDLVITPERGVHVVDGLITGWHDPEASHLLLVEAVGGPNVIGRSYAAALDAGFAGHEFGDFHLILP